MKRILPILSVMVISTVLFFSFFKKKTADNDVYIRIENKTALEFKEILLGKRIIKKDSYRSTSYETKFDDVGIKTVTSYKNTKGKHLGYSKMRLNIKPKGYLGVSVPYLQEQISKFGGTNNSFENPYSKEMIQGVNLEKGHYTYTISEKDDGISVAISKDKNP